MSRQPLKKPMRSALALAAATVTAAALTTATGVAGAAAAPQIEVADGVTQPIFSYADAIREHVFVESPVDTDGDGKRDRVNVDIIRPKETQQGLKVPVIMDESPYYDNLGRGNESERKTYDANGNPLKFPLFYDNYFVPRGYAFLAVDMVGTTRSDGCPTSGGKGDVLGGKAVIDWLNGRARAFRPDGSRVKATWTTGKVGMIGKSYDGTLPNAVAATGVKGLVTIVPISAISSWYDYSRMNGVNYFVDEEPFLANVVDTDPPEKCAAVNAAMDVEEDDETGNYNAFWDERNYREGTIARADRVRASVFAVHTVNDLNVKANHFSTWWRALAANGVPRKVWIAQYGHVDPFDFRRDVWVNTLHQWFDFWLQGVPNDVMRQPRADVETGPGQWITQSDWPAPGAVPITLRPTADGSLGLRPAAAGQTATYTDAAGDSGSGIGEDDMVADPTTAKPYRLAYVSAPIPSDMRLSGTPTAKMRVKLDKPTANLTALLVDYGEDTRVDHLGPGSGIRTLSTEDCWGASTPTDDACYRQTQTRTAEAPLNVVARGWMDAQNRTSLSSPTPLTPGQSHQINWQTLPHDYVFKAGHRLGLIFAGTDLDINTDTPSGARVTVDLAGSGITVPLVMSGPAASAVPAPRTTSTWRGPVDVDLPRQPRHFK
ncbi:MAG TPA: Xaa-Pro dipeptidyl-peptidase [Streptosporangiaceae bacterium]|nr:Xaa-Pro dipeptidyl-peptidase [Streptosporangiaceae bacterium]